MHSFALVVNSFPKISETFILNKVKILSLNGFKVTVVSHFINYHYSVNFDNKNVETVQSPITENKLKIAYKLLKNLIIYPIGLIYALFYLVRAGYNFPHIVKYLTMYLPFLKGFDIIHFSFSGLAINYLPLFPLLKKKSIIYVSCRGSAELIKANINFKRKLEFKELLHQVDRVHVVSNNILNFCLEHELNIHKAFINRPAVDSTLFENNCNVYLTKNIIQIISIGRLDWIKGFDILIQAMKLVIERHDNVHLTIVGDGPELEKLLFLSNLYKIRNCISFLGNKTPSQIKSLLSESDIYVQCSLSEGISNATLEGMSMGLAVVSTDVGGMNELIINGKDGLLIQASPEILAESISMLCQSSSLRANLGREARMKILQDFSLERQKEVYLNEYFTILKNR